MASIRGRALECKSATITGIPSISVGEQFMVRRALLIGSSHHGLQWQVARLNEVPAGLRRLGRHPALSVRTAITRA